MVKSYELMFLSILHGCKPVYYCIYMAKDLTIKITFEPVRNLSVYTIW